MLVDIVGNSIRILRKAQNMSLEDLAYLCGLDVSHLGKIERGQHNPTLETLRKIAASFKMNLSELIRAGLDDGPDIIDTFISALFPSINLHHLAMYDPLLLLDNLGRIVLEKLTLLDIERSAFGAELDTVYSLVKSYMSTPCWAVIFPMGYPHVLGIILLLLKTYAAIERRLKGSSTPLTKCRYPSANFLMPLRTLHKDTCGYANLF